MPIPLNIASIGGKPVLDPPTPDNVNWFRSTTGAGRQGHGRFLMMAADYATVAAASNGQAKLVMGDQRGAAAALSINVVVMGAVPYCTQVGGTNGVVLVTVTDKRSADDAGVTKFYNVQKSTFSYTGANPDFDAATLSSGAEWVWANVMTNLELPALPSNPTWKPRNLIFDGWQHHRVIDWIGASLFYVVGYDYATDKATFEYPGAMNAANTKLAESVKSFQIDGTRGLKNTARLPAAFDVLFKSFNADDATAPFSHRQYSKIVGTRGTTFGAGVPLHAAPHLAVYSGAAFKETANLDAVAATLAANAYAFIAVPPSIAVYAGIIPFSPDGAIREILWTSNAHGATTRIMQGTRFDWPLSANGGLSGYEDPGLPGGLPRVEMPSDQLIIGLGGANSAIGPAGSRYVWASPGIPNPTAKYQVLSAIDDALTVAWDFTRWA